MSERVGLEAFLDVTDFSRGLKTYTGGIDRIISMTGHVSQTLQFVGQVASSVFRVIGDVVSTAARTMIQLGGAAIESAISFESAFAGVLKTTDGLEDAEGRLTELGRQIQSGLRDMAMEVPADVEALAKLAEVAGQLGIQEENLLTFTRTIADLGNTTNIVGEEGAVQLAQLMNVMGTAQEDVDRLGSTIVALGNNFATTERDVLNFAQRIAGAGEIAGISEADILAMSAAFTSVGIQAEAGGTAVQKVLFAMAEAARGSTGAVIDNSEEIAKAQEKIRLLGQQLTTATMRQAEFTEKTAGSTRQANEFRIENLTGQIALWEQELASLTASHGKLGGANDMLATFAKVTGLTAEEFARTWKTDAAGAFQLFVDGLGKAGDDAMPILEKLELEDARLVRAFLSLSQATGVADSSISLLAETMGLANLAWEENSALATEAEKRYRTTESQIKITKNILKDLGITIGSATLPYLNEMLAFGQDLARDWGEKLPGLIEQYLIPALDRVWALFQQIVGFVGKVDFAALWEQLQGGDVSGLAGLLGAAGEEFDLPFLSTIGEWITAVDTWVRGTLIPAFQEVQTWIQENVIPVLDVLGEWFKQYLPIAIDEITTKWNVVLLPALLSLKEQWETTIQPALAQLWTWLQERVPQAIEALGTFWENVGKPAMTTIGTIFSEIVIPILSKVAAWLMENIPLAIDTVVAFWQETLLPAIQTVIAWVQENAIPVFESIVEWFETTIPVAIEFLSDLWTETLQPAINSVYEFLRDYVYPFLDSIANLINTVLGIALTYLSGLWYVFLTDLQIIYDYWAEFFGPALTAIGEALDDIIEYGTEVAIVLGTLLYDAVFKVGNWIKDTFNKSIDSLKLGISALTQLFNDLATAVKNLAPSLPAWMTPGSPTPLELGIRGISSAIADLAAVQLPTLQAELIATGPAASAGALAASSAGMSAAGSSYTTIDRSVSVNAPINATINNGMNVAELRGFILETVGGGIR